MEVPWPALIVIATISLVLLLSGVPMWVPFAFAPFAILIFYFRDINLSLVFTQQVMIGLRPLSLTCFPMFIFAADLICRGAGAAAVVDFVKAWIGHFPGGLAMSAAAGCTLFGAVSGSSTATVVAIGKPLRPALLEAGYSQSWTFGILIGSAGIALLIPPSLAAIIYGCAAECSIGRLFLAGVGSGLLVFSLFATYAFIYSKGKNLGMNPKASWGERLKVTKRAVPVFGFPVIILGGIFSGTFSPTEASAVSVAYAIIIEMGIYRRIGIMDILRSAREAGLILGIVLFLCGLGRFMSWSLAFAGIPQAIIPTLLGPDPTQLRLIILVLVSYFIACMFVDIVIALFVLTPLFTAYVVQLGVDPIYLGAMVILQSAIGVASPPFGINLFAASAIFRRPYWEVTRGIFVWLGLMLVANVIILIYPDIIMWLPNAMITIGQF